MVASLPWQLFAILLNYSPMQNNCDKIINVLTIKIVKRYYDNSKIKHFDDIKSFY